MVWMAARTESATTRPLSIWHSLPWLPSCSNWLSNGSATNTKHEYQCFSVYQRHHFWYKFDLFPYWEWSGLLLSILSWFTMVTTRADITNFFLDRMPLFTQLILLHHIGKTKLARLHHILRIRTGRKGCISMSSLRALLTPTGTRIIITPSDAVLGILTVWIQCSITLNII